MTHTDSCDIDEEIWGRQQTPKEISHDWILHTLEDNQVPVTNLTVSKLRGLVNSSYLVDTGTEKFFCRCADGNPDGCLKEVSLLPHISQQVLSPDTLALFEYEGFPLVFQTWFDGQTLKDFTVSTANPTQLQNTARLVGSLIAEFENIRFETSGFLDCNAAVAQPFEMTPAYFSEFISMALENCQPVLEPDLVGQVKQYVSVNASAIGQISEQNSLCHGDLHLNNVLVSKSECPEPQAIIDWESALSWTPLLDLAHLLRRKMRFHDLFEQGLTAGFTSAGGSMPEDWPIVRDLLKILSWTDKLAAGDRRQGLINSATMGLADIVAS